MAIESEVCVFWSDDGKPVGADFLRLMVRPLLASDESSTLMHLWSGNAVAMRRAALESVQKGIFRLVGNSFLSLRSSSSKWALNRAEFAHKSSSRQRNSLCRFRVNHSGGSAKNRDKSIWFWEFGIDISNSKSNLRMDSLWKFVQFDFDLF